jgi:transposase
MAEWFMPFVTKRQPLSLSAADQKRLETLRRSRSAEKRQVLHAAILLACANGLSDNAVAVAHGVNRHTVALCVRKFLRFGMDAALGELPRPGKSRRIPDDAIAWVLHCACQKPKDLGYSYELWTYALLQSHVRKHCLAASHPSLLELSRSKLHRILTQGEVRPHKIRYYVERRDPEFERKMIEVLHVYKEVEIVNAGLVEGTLKEPSTSPSPTMRNPAFRRWRRLRRTDRLRRISTRVICGTTSTNDWGQCRYWLAWICIAAGLRRLSVTATPAWTSSLY